MSFTSLQRIIIPSTLLASVVFLGMSAAFKVHEGKSLAIELDREQVFDGEVRDVGAPYIAFSLAVGIAAGTTAMSVAGWRAAGRSNAKLLERQVELSQRLEEKEAEIETLKLSPQQLASLGLHQFLEEDAELLKEVPVHEASFPQENDEPTLISDTVFIPEESNAAVADAADIPSSEPMAEVAPVSASALDLPNPYTSPVEFATAMDAAAALEPIAAPEAVTTPETVTAPAIMAATEMVAASAVAIAPAEVVRPVTSLDMSLEEDEAQSLIAGLNSWMTQASISLDMTSQTAEELSSSSQDSAAPMEPQDLQVSLGAEDTKSSSPLTSSMNTSGVLSTARHATHPVQLQQMPSVLELLKPRLDEDLSPVDTPASSTTPLPSNLMVPLNLVAPLNDGLEDVNNHTSLPGGSWPGPVQGSSSRNGGASSDILMPPSKSNAPVKAPSRAEAETDASIEDLDNWLIAIDARVSNRPSPCAKSSELHSGNGNKNGHVASNRYNPQSSVVGNEIAIAQVPVTAQAQNLNSSPSEATALGRQFGDSAQTEPSVVSFLRRDQVQQQLQLIQALEQRLQELESYVKP